MNYHYPTLQLAPVRIRRILSRVKGCIWQEETPLQVGISDGSGQALREAPSLEYKPISAGTYFSSPGWTHKWFRIVLPSADEPAPQRRYLHWNVQGESTVYLDGRPYCGLDVAHPWCLLPEDTTTLYVECGTYQTAIWPLGVDDELTPVDEYGLQFHKAVLCTRDERAWEVFHDLEVLVQLMEVRLESEGYSLVKGGLKTGLEECSPFLRRLIRDLDIAADRYDIEGLEGLGLALKKIYKRVPAETWSLKMGVVGNSHIDLVWMWPESITWKKTVHTIATMLRLADRYPEMVFTMSQPPLIDRIRRDAPDLYQELRQKFESGHWEATGVMEVEADTLIPCGEALIRSVLTGKERFRDLTGTEGQTLWLPDVFGYSQCIPQICALAGISNFFTTKMTWSEMNRFPHNSFQWESQDGSTVLAHLANCGYVSAMDVKQADRNARSYRQSDVHDEILIAIGYGDGGGGVTEGQCERVRRMANLATIPRARWTGVDDFFRRLEDSRDELPVFRGEMYLEYHRGTYTVQSEFKRLYRACERAIQTYEAACVWYGAAPEHRDAWSRILFSQFHDAIPGSSIQLVYDQMNPELADMIRELDDRTMSLLSASDRAGKGAPVFFSSAAAGGTWLAELPEEIWRSEYGDRKPIQRSGDSILVPVVFDGPGVQPGTIQERENDTIVAEPGVLGNGRVEARFNPAGALTSMTVDGRELRLEGAARFMIHEDHPVNFEAWDIDRNAMWLGKEAVPGLDLEVLESGPLRVVLRGESRLGAESRLVVNYILEKDSPVLMVDLEIDWRERNKLLRYEIPTGYMGQDALFGAPFGSVRRRQFLNTSHDAARWEVPGSRWMAVVDDSGAGLGLVTQAKYGFSCLEGRAGISLLRSPRTPDNESIHRQEKFSDQGTHWIRFALTLHDPLGTGVSAPILAETLFSPPLICRSTRVGTLFSLRDSASLVASWVQPGDNIDSYFIRLHETLGFPGEGQLVFPDPPARIVLTDFVGSEKKVLKPADGNTYPLPYSPYEILTLKVETSDSGTD